MLRLMLLNPSYLLCFLAVGNGAGGVPAGLQSQVVVPFNHRQVVACTKVSLQEEGGAHAAELTMGNDSNSVPQYVSLIHVMSGQNDCTA